MMWRYTHEPQKIRVRDEIHTAPGEGYCGIAGREPQL